MKKYTIFSECSTFDCPQYEVREDLVVVQNEEDIRKKTIELKKEKKEKHLLCKECKKELDIRYKAELIITEEIQATIDSILSLMDNFIEKHGKGIVYREVKPRRWPEYWDKKEWALLTPAELRDFEYYGLMAGDVATIHYDGERLQVEIESNTYNKEVIRKLTTMYTFDTCVDDYDQLSAPHWCYYFNFDNTDELAQFLDHAWTWQQEVGERYKRTNTGFLYGITKDKETEDNYFVHFVEKEDWEAFNEQIGEHYHGSDKRLASLKKKLDLTEYGYATFRCKKPKKYMLEVLEEEPHIEFNEVFQTYLLEDDTH